MTSVFLITGSVPDVPVHLEVLSKKPLELVLNTSFQKIPHRVAARKATQLAQTDTETAFLWKNVTLMRAASSAFVDAISFIPFKVSQSQLLFARRTEEEDRTGFVDPTAFYAGECASDIIFVSSNTISAATKGIEGQFIKDVKGILEAFFKDKQTRAIALTFQQGQEKAIRLWSKTFQ